MLNKKTLEEVLIKLHSQVRLKFLAINILFFRRTEVLFCRIRSLILSTSLALIAGFRAGLADWNLGFPKNTPLETRQPSKARFNNISLCGFELGF